MGEHRQPEQAAKKAKWDSLRGVDLRHKRYVWRSSEKGTFKYPSGTYGALRTRREYKIARKFIKSTGLRGKERTMVMLNIMGVIDE